MLLTNRPAGAGVVRVVRWINVVLIEANDGYTRMILHPSVEVAARNLILVVTFDQQHLTNFDVVGEYVRQVVVMVGVRMRHDNGVDARVCLIELVADVITHCVTVAVCSRAGVNQDEAAVGALDQCAVALADLNEVKD